MWVPQSTTNFGGVRSTRLGSIARWGIIVGVGTTSRSAPSRATARSNMEMCRRSRWSPHSTLVQNIFLWLAVIRAVLESVKWDSSFKRLHPTFVFVTSRIAVCSLFQFSPVPVYSVLFIISAYILI